VVGKRATMCFFQNSGVDLVEKALKILDSKSFVGSSVNSSGQKFTDSKSFVVSSVNYWSQSFVIQNFFLLDHPSIHFYIHDCLASLQ
jgi:hypothetical protein